MEHKVVLAAVIAGLALAGFGVPHVLAHSPTPLVRELRLVFLAPMCILLFQIAIAWTPALAGAACFRAPRPGRDWLWILPGALALAAARWFWTDPLAEQLKPGFFPGDAKTWLTDLPWICGFQPLVLIAAPYAFAARLLHYRPLTRGAAHPAERRLTLCLVFTVTLQALAAWYHWEHAPLPQQLFLTLFAGSAGLFLAWVYHRAGWWALCLTTSLMYARLLLPP